MNGWKCREEASRSETGRRKKTCMSTDPYFFTQDLKGEKERKRKETIHMSTRRQPANVTRQGRKKRNKKEKEKRGEREAGEGKKRPKTHYNGQVDAASVSAQESGPHVTVRKHNGWESSNNAQRLSHNAPRGQLANGLLQRARDHVGPRVYPVILPPVLLTRFRPHVAISFFFFFFFALSLSFFLSPALFPVTFSPSKSTNSWNETRVDFEIPARRTFSSRSRVDRRS